VPGSPRLFTSVIAVHKLVSPVVVCSAAAHTDFVVILVLTQTQISTENMNLT